MSKSIQPVSVWVGGEVKTAKYLGMISVNDNLESSATFYYQLYAEALDEQGLPIIGESLIGGNLTMDGQDYEDWGNQSGVDINTWAYNWSASKLNIVII